MKTKHALFSQDQDQFIKWFDNYDKQAIKEAIIEHLGQNEGDTLEHCKEYGKGSVKNYYGQEIVNFYVSSNGRPCKVYMKNGKEYLRALTLSLCLLFGVFAANAQKSVTYHVHFPEYVQLAAITQKGDTIHGWHGSGTFKLKMKQGETPLSLIVASEKKRTNLTFLPPNGEEKVYHVYEFKNTILSGK